jgi:uncharacterized protein (DUF433 family)
MSPDAFLETDRAAELVSNLEGSMNERFPRITVDPAQMGGVPCIRGLRIPVATVVALVAQGVSQQEILGEYPDLEVEDISEALRYAAAVLDERVLPLRTSA